MATTKKKSIKEDVVQDDFEDVAATAQMAHYGQKRRTGEDYITHPAEVSQIVKQFYPTDKVSRLVALLHDTMEDAPSQGTVKDIDEMKSFIRGSIGDEKVAEDVIDAVESLTHDKEAQPDYGAYVQTILGNKIALRVKLADMLHNLTNNASDKQKKKYGDALKKISGLVGGGVPKSISPHHWRALAQASGTNLMQKESIVMTKSNLKETIRKIVKEQMTMHGDEDIKTKIESFVYSWIQSNRDLIQQTLEDFAMDGDQNPPLGSELREIFFDTLIADATELEVVKSLSQDQGSVNDIVDRLLTKEIDKEWPTALQVAKSNKFDSIENRYGHEVDPYSRYGLSRDDF